MTENGPGDMAVDNYVYVVCAPQWPRQHLIEELWTEWLGYLSRMGAEVKHNVTDGERVIADFFGTRPEPGVVVIWRDDAGRREAFSFHETGHGSSDARALRDIVVRFLASARDAGFRTSLIRPSETKPLDELLDAAGRHEDILLIVFDRGAFSLPSGLVRPREPLRLAKAAAGYPRAASNPRARRASPGYASGPEPPPQLPFRVRDEPLPHDGLFVRRNNAFGTKSTLGITDLIEQGVLIDQTQIRFDDFIASRTDGIPLPENGEAVAVGHGCAAVQGEMTASRSSTHFLEIAIRAAEQADSPARVTAPLPVNFIFVVDTSASMSGEKLDTVKVALRQLYQQLRDSDVLGIVTFDTQVRTVLRATRKADLPADDLTAVIQGMQADGGTDLNLGLLYGIDEAGRYGNDQTGLVSCLYLFSDGDPTSGETNWIKIRSNLAARLRGNLTISCFGFGTDARIRELEALAGTSGGHFTFVTGPDDVRIDLAEDLARRENLAAINLQLRIDIAPHIRIWHLYGHDLVTDPAARDAVVRDSQQARRVGRERFGTDALPDLITEETGVRIFAPDLAYGETYWIVFELEVPDQEEQATFGNAAIQYVDTHARASRRHDLDLTPLGTIPADTVTVHAVGMWTSEVTFYALDDLYQHDRATAKQRLSQHLNVLQTAHTMLPAAQFRDDQVTIAKLISLSQNLDLPLNWQEPGTRAGRAPWNYTVHTMNAFGQVRAGYNRITGRT